MIFFNQQFNLLYFNKKLQQPVALGFSLRSVNIADVNGFNLTHNLSLF